MTNLYTSMCVDDKLSATNKYNMTFKGSASRECYAECVIPRLFDQITNARVIFADDCSNPYHLVESCILYIQNMLAPSLSDCAVYKISGDGLLLYDAVFRPDIINHNIKTKSLLIPHFDNQRFYLAKLSRTELKLCVKLKDVNLNDIKLALAQSIKRQEFARLPPEILDNIGKHYDPADYDPYKSVLCCQYNGIWFPFSYRNKLQKRWNHLNYVGYEEISITRSTGLKINKDNISIDLNFDCKVFVLIFALYNVKGKLLNYLNRYTIYFNQTILHEGDKNDALIYNKAVNYLPIPQTIEELPVGAVFFCAPIKEQIESYWDFKKMSIYGKLVLELGVSNIDEISRVHCLALTYDTLFYECGGWVPGKLYNKK